MTTRKFFTELGINVTVLDQYMGRQRELQNEKSFPVTCNLYMVTRRPRMSIDPGSVGFHAGRMTGILRIQRQSQFDEVPFSVSTKDLGRGPFRYESEWPHEEYRVYDADGEVSGGIVALAAVEFGMILARRVPHEVLYVGQAFGKAGERTAFDRLKSHSTLQRIYAECPPDKEIWLHLCRVSDITLFMEFNPQVPSRTTDEEDEQHRNRVLRRIHSVGFAEREAVAIGEAGLIRYFQPQYNEKFRNNYPDPKHVHISTCYDLDLATIAVELQGQETRSFFYGPAVDKASPLHMFRFPLYETAGFIVDWHGGKPST
ncbi:hypothetical protein [Micromonospora sp. NPDC051006]|uniref:hypothetical protein n=1 Tax=Micromonospora sp. NPDC051006 TaxID=3364283 RepID=UPI00379795CB